MAKNLIIVESPTKVNTIKKFLGKNYTVTASNGHVRDLPKSTMGVDVDNDYEPKYITIRGKGDLLAGLRKEVKKADKIYLATDPDREGEAISWHLITALNLEGKNVNRISFNEITKKAVKDALKNPRNIDMDLVDAQQARRVLDRVVGYEISPVLWDKVKRGLSAGRVQSAALNIICAREKEISEFIPEEYYTLDAKLKSKGAKKVTFDAAFYGDNKSKIEITGKKELDKICSELDGASYKVESVVNSKREKKTPLPFTTSTMQQEASKQLNFAISKTMNVAQQLYEGINISKVGTVGLITYLRTDSVRIADEAKDACQQFVESEYGKEYVGDYVAKDKKKAKIQDAHEAIRPADVTLTPAMVKSSLNAAQYKLYNLIWKRFVASQMTNAVYDVIKVKVSAKDYIFSASTSKTAFDGFMSVYKDSDDKEDKKQKLDSLKEGDSLELVSLDETQHFTQPPAHYTEASIVRTLEELGIGRPSTYSPIISTLLKRRYIGKEGKNIFVTEMGDIVNGLMNKAFPEIVDEKFTAKLEDELDGVEEGDVPWKDIIRDIYPKVHSEVKDALDNLEKVTILDEETDVICEECGSNMVIKYGRYGKFLACPNFPECRNTKPYLEKIGVACPKCGKDVIICKTKKGRTYYGCEGYPDCDFMNWNRPVSKKCPECGGYMVIKGKKLVCQNQECGYVCDNSES
ncbi:MAG: type I DNA topoisomerase [Lachnospiraceae bacterium]|nr:type I DNA topoisomerase [Lachnospiraceae bacterium]